MFTYSVTVVIISVATIVAIVISARDTRPRDVRLFDAWKDVRNGDTFWHNKAGSDNVDAAECFNEWSA